MNSVFIMSLPNYFKSPFYDLYILIFVPKKKSLVRKFWMVTLQEIGRWVAVTILGVVTKTSLNTGWSWTAKCFIFIFWVIWWMRLRFLCRCIKTFILFCHKKNTFFSNFSVWIILVASCFYFTFFNHVMKFISATVITKFGFLVPRLRG